MRTQQFVKIAAGAALTLSVIVLAAMSGTPQRVEAQDQDNDDMSRVHIGFKIAPVPLKLEGRDPNLVGLGSYLVNAVGDCNGCHSSGAPPIFIYPFKTGRNPFFAQPEKIDPAVYLDGGANFGSVGTPSGPSGYGGPNIISRNLTPDRNGLPEGGHTLSQFKQIFKSGTDFDHIHPTCTAAQVAAIMGGATPNCIPTGNIPLGPGVNYNNIPDGDLLQVMPWPTFSHMSDRDIEAIYEYLSAIPCIDNTMSTPPAGAPNELRNDCGSNDNVQDSEIQHSTRSLRRR